MMGSPSQRGGAVDEGLVRDRGDRVVAAVHVEDGLRELRGRELQRRASHDANLELALLRGPPDEDLVVLAELAALEQSLDGIALVHRLLLRHLSRLRHRRHEVAVFILRRRHVGGDAPDPGAHRLVERLPERLSVDVPHELHEERLIEGAGEQRPAVCHLLLAPGGVDVHGDAVNLDVDDGDFLLPHARTDALHRITAVDIERLRERHLRRGLDDAERPGDDLVVALIWLNRKRRASAGSRADRAGVAARRGDDARGERGSHHRAGHRHRGDRTKTDVLGVVRSARVWVPRRREVFSCFPAFPFLIGHLADFSNSGVPNQEKVPREIESRGCGGAGNWQLEGNRIPAEARATPSPLFQPRLTRFPACIRPCRRSRPRPRSSRAVDA